MTPAPLSCWSSSGSTCDGLGETSHGAGDRPAGFVEPADESHDALLEAARRHVAELVEARDRVAVGRFGGMPEQFDEAALDLLAHDVLPAARLFVHVGPVEADDIREQALGEAVLAHDVDGLLAAARR